MKPQSKQFNNLKSLWYKKLADSGFTDIENSEGLLNTWASEPRSYNTVLSSESKQEYYRLAGHFLHDYKFANTTDKIIWQYHSDGISHRDIVILLKNHQVITERNKVLSSIQRLRTAMTKLYGGKSRG